MSWYSNAANLHRTLLSERKIDEIAEGLEAVKVLLHKSLLPIRQESDGNILLHTPDSVTTWPPIPSEYNACTSQEPAKWDHSAQVSDFVRIVAEDRASREDPRSEESDVLASLRRVARALEDSDAARDLSFPETRGAKSQDHQSMPPAGAAVIVLRWAKGQSTHSRLADGVANNACLQSTKHILEYKPSLVFSLWNNSRTFVRRCALQLMNTPSSIL